ncbi:hypothetical protein [Deinococcus koreensis]|uniref:Uncharacterized protein n=1 Tax=Deinococcus koreensis TaxID=2054903 RepID=A0A2K3URL8_9DEIO|nr:hypothetical protein [Deinococcus koreensis]PNY79189.1 hypothetical protein CVO96_20535 [Deinococcus koreensis]
MTVLEQQDVQPAHWTPAQRTRNERMSAFLRALHVEGMLTAACAASGVSLPSVRRWRNDFPSFDEAVTEFLTRIRLSAVEDNMYRIATSTDPKIANATVKAGEFLARAWDREQYGERQRIDQTITVNGQVQIVHEARDTIRQELRASRQQRLLALQTIDAPPSSGDRGS